VPELVANDDGVVEAEHHDVLLIHLTAYHGGLTFASLCVNDV
jgi:hypothetical protein